VCDRCGREHKEIARAQGDLPHPDAMRARGWFIAEIYGDLCDSCVLETGGSGA
jgi:hypothetical protein